MEIEIHAVDFAASVCQTRLPFRFGIVTLTEAPVLLARVRARVEGRDVEGWSGDLCVPKWFEKDLRKSVRDDVASLFRSARRAATAIQGSVGTPFSIWHVANRRCVEGDLASGIRLVDGFGVALVERAMIDATCRGIDRSFRDALSEDVFGFEPGRLLSQTEGLRSPDILATPAHETVLLRHTVGGLDPLRLADVKGEDIREDGHPVALEEDIRRFGLRAFKLKASGEPEADADRLCEIAQVVNECGVLAPVYTLDANESFKNTADIHDLLDRLEAREEGRLILEGLTYLEQPLPRTETLDPSTEADIRALSGRVDLLIDEADDCVDAFDRALNIGYRGVSVKNCKGVFRALTNRALCIVRGDGTFQTSEDLTNLPMLPLQQDLTTLAALGLTHSERNGHHFFPGLDVVPPQEAEVALAAHPDLYERRGDRIVLRIEEGRLSLACQHSIGFGYDAPVDWAARQDLAVIEAEGWGERSG